MARLQLQHRRCNGPCWMSMGASTFVCSPGSRLATHSLQHQVSASCHSRLRSHGLAGTSGREATGSRSRAVQVHAALLEPPPFQPDKLQVQRLPGARLTGSMTGPRRYTLTHNDVTGELQLSIGTAFNQRQVDGFYTRLLRDEITAEWEFAAGGDASNAVLRVHCHVSGEERWLAPPQLRNFIFRREMGLVLDTFMYGDSELLAAHPRLLEAHVLVHFHSHVKALDVVEYWGKLGERRSWQSMPRELLARLNLLFFGFPAATGLPLALGAQLQQVTASQAEAAIDEAMDYLGLDPSINGGSSSSNGSSSSISSGRGMSGDSGGAASSVTAGSSGRSSSNGSSGGVGSSDGTRSSSGANGSTATTSSSGSKGGRDTGSTTAAVSSSSHSNGNGASSSSSSSMNGSSREYSECQSSSQATLRSNGFATAQTALQETQSSAYSVGVEADVGIARQAAADVALQRPRAPAEVQVLAAQPGQPLLVGCSTGADSDSQQHTAGQWRALETLQSTASRFATAASVSSVQEPLSDMSDSSGPASQQSNGREQLLVAGDSTAASLQRRGGSEPLLRPKPVPVVCGSADGVRCL